MGYPERQGNRASPEAFPWLIPGAASANEEKAIRVGDPVGAAEIGRARGHGCRDGPGLRADLDGHGPLGNRNPCPARGKSGRRGGYRHSHADLRHRCGLDGGRLHDDGG